MMGEEISEEFEEAYRQGYNDGFAEGMEYMHEKCINTIKTIWKVSEEDE